jgi:hypothetical protein
MSNGLIYAAVKISRPEKRAPRQGRSNHAPIERKNREAFAHNPAEPAISFSASIFAFRMRRVLNDVEYANG